MVSPIFTHYIISCVYFTGKCYIPIHKEAMQTLDEAGRSKAALIADAIRIRNAIFNRNTDGFATVLPIVSQQSAPMQSQSERMGEALPLPSKPNTQDTSGAVKSEDDFWEGMNDTLKMFSV